MDTNELVMATFGFDSVEQWKADPHLGDKTLDELADAMNFDSIQEWYDAVMPLHLENKRRIIEALSGLWKAIGKPVNKDQMQIYYHAFAGYPPDVVERGVEAILKTHRYSNIPTLADMIESMK